MKHYLVIGALALGSLTMTACTNGSQGTVQSVTLNSSVVNGDLQITADAALNTGTVTVLPAAFPIYNPKNPAQTLGQLSIISGFGTTSLEVELDVTQVLAAVGGATTTILPNGTTIPVSGVSASNWITLPVASGTSALYLNYDLKNKKALVGVSLNIDQLSTGIAGDVFLPFAFNGVSGVAGVYTGAVAGTSGIATFIDLSSTINSLTPKVKLRHAHFRARSHQAKKIQSKIIELESRGAVLTVR